MENQNLHGESVLKETPNINIERIAELTTFFPEVFSEGKVDWEKLHVALGDFVDERPERYSFTWAGKRDAIRILQTPSRATLVPSREESIDFDSSENIFIEGENLETLKLLYKAYFGRVKMIYIDPPYNTGKDFIYPDNYTDPLDAYLRLTGQKDENGNVLTSNPETSGRFHSRWLSMMYPRLFLARQLLTDDGVILVSIDDNEAANLRSIMNEIFGEENRVAQLVWEKGRKNDAKLFSVGHEYILVYARSLATLKQMKVVWREPKPGAQEIWDEYIRLRERFGDDDDVVEQALRDWYKQLPAKHPSKALSRYKHIDKYGPWRDRDISWPGGGGPRYEVIHPVTKQPCKTPEGGWRFATPEAMQKQIDLGLVVFREDHTEPPFRKAHLRPIPEELDEDEAISGDEDTAEEEAVGMQVMPSVIYKQSQVAVKYLRKLMGADVFPNPKDHEVLARLIRYCTSPGDLILDFFAGAGASAEAVLQLNNKDAGGRRFIMVQLPEPTPEKSNARKAGYKTISEIGRERIRRVCANIKKSGDSGQFDLPEFKKPAQDLGFKVFKLAESNFKPWTGAGGKTDNPVNPEEYAHQMEAFADPLVEGWTVESVIYEVALKEGYGLTCRVERIKDIEGLEVYRVRDNDKNQSLYICLDDVIKLEALGPLAMNSEDLFICRDIALNDETAANLALQCRLKTI